MVGLHKKQETLRKREIIRVRGCNFELYENALSFVRNY